MTPEQLAALKAGASIQDVLAMSADSDPEVILAAAAQVAEQSDDDGDGDPVPAITADADAELASLKAVNAEQAAELQGLKAKLAEFEASAAASATAADELKKLQAAHASTVATLNAMTAPLKAYATKMGVALGKPVDLEGKSASEVLAAHTELSAGYAKAFVSGRKSAPAAAPDTKASDSKPSWLATASTLNF